MLWAFITRWHRPIIGVALLLAMFLALRLYVAGEVKKARQADAVAVLQADAKADDVAGQVAASEQAQVERENDEARAAANAGTDPLGDGLRKLRTGKTGNR